MTDRIEAQIERFAPGFRDLVLARRATNAAEIGRRNPNDVGGDITGGVATLRQTIFRPTVSWNPYRTPLVGVYLCSSSTPPGGGVHVRLRSGEGGAFRSRRRHLTGNLAFRRSCWQHGRTPVLTLGFPQAPRRVVTYNIGAGGGRVPGSDAGRIGREEVPCASNPQ